MTIDERISALTALVELQAREGEAQRLRIEKLAELIGQESLRVRIHKLVQLVERDTENVRVLARAIKHERQERRRPAVAGERSEP